MTLAHSRRLPSLSSSSLRSQSVLGLTLVLAMVVVASLGWGLSVPASLSTQTSRQLLAPARTTTLNIANQAIAAADHALLDATMAVWDTLKKGTERKGTIPPILHQIFLDGEAQYQIEGASNTTKFLTSWRDTCKAQHPDWTYMWWDMAAARTFLQAHFSWFLPTFEAYPKTVLKGDALRPFLLYHYGGVYLDLDCECFRPMNAWLDAYDLVLQSEYRTARDIVNAVMASAPRHRYWKLVIRIMMRKFDGLSPGPTLSPMAIIGATGPGVTTMALKQYLGSQLQGNGALVGDWVVRDLRLRVYGLGDWFVPCEWDDHPCHERTVANAAHGIIPLALAGYHHYAGSWLHTVRPPPVPTVAAAPHVTVPLASLPVAVGPQGTGAGGAFGAPGAGLSVADVARRQRQPIRHRRRSHPEA